MGLVKVSIGPILLYHMWCGGLYHVPLDMFYKECQLMEIFVLKYVKCVLQNVICRHFEKWSWAGENVP